MLSHDIFIEGIVKLENAFGKELSLYQRNVYEEFLKEMSNERFNQAVERIIKEEAFFPKIRDFFIVSSEDAPQEDVWKDKDLYWYFDEGRLRAKVVPKGKGNRKPVITYKYEEEKKEEATEKLKELKRKIWKREKEKEEEKKKLGEARKELQEYLKSKGLD